MASNLLTTDRRWAAPTRKSGMTVLGKVPKPINLPSQRLENNGLDPNLEIVPKGTLTWGSKPTQITPNAWGSSSILSTKNDGSSSSPSHLNGRPSSGGGSRPSTAGSESLGSPNAWGPNSRPSSASGTFPSSHLPMTTNRPRSAETGPGSSQLSRFADNASENVKSSASHGHGFTLSTGDFPTLGSEKCSESRSQQGHSSKGRPTSSSGKEASQNDQGKSLTAGSDEVISTPSNQTVDILKTDQQHAHTGGAPFPATSLPNEWQQPQPYPPNFHMPPQFDSWHAPPGNAPEGIWHRGAAPGGPYRPVGPPGSFPVEPFGYYGQFPPNSEAATRQGSGHGAYRPKNGDPYHPMPPNSYVMNQPVIPVRPVYQVPGPYDGYYGPRANFNNANVRDPHLVGGPHQPGILNQFPNQNDRFHHGQSQGRPSKQIQREQLESGKVQVFNRGQPRILHDNPDRRGGTHEMEKNAQQAPPLLPHPDGKHAVLNMRMDMKDSLVDRNRVFTKSLPEQRGPVGIEHPPAFDNSNSFPRDTGDDTLRKKVKEDNSGILDQPVIKRNAALIEKIESLNNKARNVDARNIPESVSSKEFRRLQKSTDSKADQLTKDVQSTAVVSGVASVSDQRDSVPHIASVLQKPPNVHSDCTVVGLLHSQLSEFSQDGKLGDSNYDRPHERGDSSRNSLHDPAKHRSANKFAGHGRGESSITDSLPVTDLRSNNQNDQSPADASQLQPSAVTDDMAASIDYESQRAKMKELAVQRAKKLQAEEEERIKNQKAKALAKLEELNRRSAVLQKKSNDTAVETGEGNVKQKAGLDVAAKLDTSTAELCDVAAPDSLTALQPPNDKNTMLLVQPHSISHGAGVGKSPVAHGASSSAGNIQSNLEHVVQKTTAQSHDISVPKPKQGFRKRHVASEEKNPGENLSVPVGTGNAKKNVESSFDTKTAITKSHDDHPAPNKKGARHLRNKKKVEGAPVAQDPPVVFNEQNASKISTEPKTYTGGVIISSSIVPTEGAIVTVGSITVGGISVPSLKQECVTSSDGTPSTENNRSRPQQARRSGKYQHAVCPVEKPDNEGVLWALVKQRETSEQSDRAMPNTAVSDPTQLSGKSSNDGENVTRTKRAEMERYVPKPLSKELQQQNLGSNLLSEKTCVDNKNKIHDKEALVKSSDAKVDPTIEPKKWEDKKAGKGHGKSHPSWHRRNTHESAPVVPNAMDQAESSHESKEVQKSADQSQSNESDRQEIKQFKSQTDTAAENSSATTETVPLPVSGAKEHSASNRQRRHHVKAQRNETSGYPIESKDREGRDDFVYQSATPAMDSNSSSHRNSSRSDVKSSGAVSHSRAHWKPKSNSHSQGNNAVEGQLDSHGGTNEMNSSKGSDNTAHQDSSDKSIKRSDVADEKDAHSEQENLTKEDGQQNNETHKSAEQKQVNPPVRRQGHHSGRYNRGDSHRGRGYDAGSGRPNHGTNVERRRGGGHLEYQPVGSYKPKDFQQNPSIDERTEGPPTSGPVFRERGHSRGSRPTGHFVKRSPASTSTTNTYQEE